MDFKIKIAFYILVSVINVLLCLLLDSYGIFSLKNMLGGVYQSVLGSFIFSFPITFIALKVGLRTKSLSEQNIYQDDRISLVEKESRIFDELIKTEKAISIRDSNKLRELLQDARNEFKYSVHMLPFNYQSIRYYNVREGKAWLEFESSQRDRIDIKRIYIIDFDEDNDEKFDYEGEILTQKQAVLKIYEKLDSTCRSCFVYAKDMLDEGEMIRDYGLFFDNADNIKIGFFAFKGLEQRFTKALSNHYFSKDSDYLLKIMSEFEERWNKSFNKKTSKRILDSLKKSKQ